MNQPEVYSAFMSMPPAQAPVSAPAPARAGDPATMGSAKSYVVPRRGKRPLSFSGTELCMAMNFVAGCYSWYEINIYRTVEQKFVLVVRQFFRDEEEQDTARAWECEGFGDVMDKLEAYDAADDVKVTVFADDPSLSIPEMAAHALALRARAESQRSQFGALVGQILHELDADA